MFVETLACNFKTNKFKRFQYKMNYFFEEVNSKVLNEILEIINLNTKGHDPENFKHIDICCLAMEDYHIEAGECVDINRKDINWNINECNCEIVEIDSNYVNQLRSES